MVTERHTSDAVVIGAGFAGIAAATRLALEGRSVTVVERHEQPGGRARKFEVSGFVFDMGPSWYWMPDVFEEYFRWAGSEVGAHLDLVRLDPSYRVWFSDGPVDIPAGKESVGALFDRMEPGAGARLELFLGEAERKYRVGMDRFVRRPGHSILEFAELGIIPDLLKLSMFGSLSTHVRSFFSDPRIVQILEFPALFLGARPEQTPALYSMMNYADTVLGTWYPMGGMHRLVEAMVDVARGLGVEFVFGADVDAVVERGGAVAGVQVGAKEYAADTVVAAADYHHVEQHLLPAKWRRYKESYWTSRVMSPGSLLFYLGLDRRVEGLEHHNLFFDAPFEPHARTIYDEPGWPEDPMFYVCAPSKTDPSVAPEGCENLFVLVPLATGMAHDPGAQQKLFDVVMDRIQGKLNVDLRPHVVYRRDYAHREFQADYNSFRGNAYGLANTLRQTAFLKPKMRSRLPGLFFAGQLTTPGPGVPPSLISGQVAGNEASAWLNSRAGVRPQAA
ncbi:MAG: phytoene desaturase [Rhodothermales bacterium]|jgi:phytoene desaturase